jgi:hypothetical protein
MNTIPSPHLNSRPHVKYGKILGYLIPVVLGAAVLWSAYVHWTGPFLPFDDAFITFRYVENLVNGKGLVYNEGERIFGSSTPLYLLALVVVKFLFVSTPLPVLSVLFNMAPFAFSGLAVYLLLRTLTGHRFYAALCSAAFLVEPRFLAWSLGGMESFLFSTLLLLAFWAATKRRPIWLGLFIGLTCLTRPEGILLAAVVIAAFFREKKFLLLTAAACVLVVLPWILFTFYYYGSPIPLSLIAKSRPLYDLPPGHASSRMTARFADWLVGRPFSRVPETGAYIALGLVGLSTLVSLASKVYRDRKAWLPGVMFCAYFGFYTIGNPLIFSWYWPPVFICGSLALIIAIPALGHLLEEWLEWRGKKIPSVSRGVTITVLIPGGLILLAALIRYGVGEGPQDLILNNPERLRIKAYQEAAERINEVSEKTDVVASPEVGSLGFYCKGRVLDACGLVSPEAIPFLPVPKKQRPRDPSVGSISVELVKETQPDFVVVMPTFAAFSLARSKWFYNHYTQMLSIPLPQKCWGSETLRIFRKKQ